MSPRKRKPIHKDEEEEPEQQSNKKHCTEEGGNFLQKFANAGSKLKFDLKWCNLPIENKVPPLYFLTSSSLPACSKIAAFDIDFTVIVTKSGRSFPTSSSDWLFFDKQKVPTKLRELHNTGYRVVFITNQAGIEKNKTKFSDLKKKFEDILVELKIPVYILIATGESHFRKPSTGMWSFLSEKCNGKDMVIDIEESFYVGDAAGRPKDWAPGKKKDFSCGDRMFAHNVGLKFYTPEEFFLGHKAVDFEWRSIDPELVIQKQQEKNKESESVDESYHSKTQELVLMIGWPASGKSTFTRRFLVPHNYEHVNRDTLGTQDKCLKAVEKALKAGKSVCVDNTNPSKKVRGEYLSVAKKCGVKQVRCFKMETPRELCHHLNYVRQNHTKGKSRRVPDVGFNMFKSQYEEPNQEEGFTEIKPIHFVARFDDQHGGKELETIFKQRTNT